MYTMEYHSAIKKNTFESVLMRWMKLEPIIQSEVSQKEKHQYSILKHIYGIWKDGNDNPVCETAKETQLYRIIFWTLTSLSLFTFMHWRRKWQPTPEFLPGESQGWGSLVGCRLWGHTESDMTEAT